MHNTMYKSRNLIVLLAVSLLLLRPTSDLFGKDVPTPDVAKAAFLKLLDRPKVPADVQVTTPLSTANGMVTGHFSIASERKADGKVERVPILLVRPEQAKGKLPTVIVLHGTSGS